MKALKIICILFLIVNFVSWGFAEDVKRVSKVIDVSGKVIVKPSGEKGWIPVQKGMIISEGDILKTKVNSWALLNLNGSGETATVEVEENSQLAFTELTKDDQGVEKTFLDLALGKLLIEAKKLESEKSKFEVKTPTSIVGVRGTTFAIEVEAID
ncbi:MAG: FecR domain-containing protein [Candidatus Omnitrophica bacterium]|nr:FecR domain-containing protein [Candidatus Omnitrophota bacterium]MBU1367569.1 FecR domain-containing protein [Candidatus Omnitrophota bacterium]MBU1523212.1 FecR domain-containing protein [Candidatus Omnitrophota bacterium]